MDFNVTLEDAVAVARKNGMAAGVAVGKAEGILQTVLQTARQMRAKGFNATVISEITGLSEEEIMNLN
jgi:predicted transposase/invertase (TIGR01784 family)